MNFVVELRHFKRKNKSYQGNYRREKKGFKISRLLRRKYIENWSYVKRKRKSWKNKWRKRMR